MNRLIAVTAVALLAFCPLVSNASTTYKCKAENGRFTFQDKPCEAGAQGQQVLNTSAGGANPVMTSMISEALLVGTRTGVHKAQKKGQATNKSVACVDALDATLFNSVVNAAFAEYYTPSELRTANAYFETPSGRKFARAFVTGAYKSTGQTPPEPTPEFTSAEEKAYEAFVRSSAGDKLVNKDFMGSPASRAKIIPRVQELVRNCSR